MPDDSQSTDRRQRRNFWRRHVHRWRESGLNQSAYCRLHALDAHRFYRWRESGLNQSAYCRLHALDVHRFYRWRRRILAAADAVAFVPVAVSNPRADGQPPAVRIHTPNGFTVDIRLDGPEAVGRLVAMVAAL